LPRNRFASSVPLESAQDRANGFDQIKQCRSLMADLVHQRRTDPAADHPLARYANDCDRVFAPARQSRSRPPDCRAVAAIEIADHRRWVVITARERERIGRDRIEPREPDTGLAFASLCQGICEDVELRERRVETQTQHRKAALRFGRRCREPSGAFKPAEKFVHQTMYFSSSD